MEEGINLSIEQKIVKSGKRYRANVYTNGKRALGKWHKFKKRAELDEIEFKHKIHSGDYIKETNKTFNECTEVYFQLIAPKKMKSSTIHIEKTYYNKHIKPVFGHRKIVSIKAYEIQQLWTDKEESLASSTIARLHNLMNKVFTLFIKWDEIKKNPMSNVEKPRVKYKKTDIWSKDEMKRFLDYSRDFNSHIVFWFALNTGLRQGEILALHWSDIDFEKQILYVRYNLDRVTRKRGTLKTDSSERFIYLTDSQINILKEHRNQQIVKSNIVCASTIGTYLEPRNIRRTMLIICKRADLEPIRFHDLRHTHGTLFLQVTKDVKATQQRLGHADVRMTLDRYVHNTDTTQQQTSELFSNYMDDELVTDPSPKKE